MNKILVQCALAAATLTSSLAQAGSPRVVISVYLSQNTISIVKSNKRKRYELVGPIIPVAPGSIEPGVYRIQKDVYEDYWTPKGNVMLKNVISFGPNKKLRSSRMFHEWKNSNRPAGSSIVMEPEIGSIVLKTIRQYGPERTRIQIIR